MNVLPNRSAGGMERGPVRGSALVGTLVCAVCLFGLVYATTSLSSLDLMKSRRNLEEVRATYLAEAGVEEGIHYLRDVARKCAHFDPLYGLRNLFDGGATVTLLSGTPVTDGTRTAGEVTVTMTGVEEEDAMVVTIQATGYVPAAPAHLAAGEQVLAWEGISSTVRVETEPGAIFDYAYFINNWGWFYGSTIVCNGNARSNGQFDAAGYAPWVNGQPLYEGMEYDGNDVTLLGYQDDNGDGLDDGQDGGVFAGWDIVNTQNVRGVGGRPQNQHDFLDPLLMPNLTDLSRYEEEAKAEGGQIVIDGNVMSNAVYGDEPGEKQHLYLVGTPQHPVEIHGKVVVRGDVIIKGTVTGQGTLFSGGNVYVPDSITYANPPTSPRPGGNDRASTESWLEQNWNKDFLGLFARENVVVGDYTDGLWRYYVGHWMAHSMNQSKEDAGADKIPNTRNGKDGIPGTADDDVLEGDGVFSIEYYTQDDQDAGIIPPGSSVGDPIPGTGEDIDGDGVYDPTTDLGDLDFQAPLNDMNWGGNIHGTVHYDHIASLYAGNLDAAVYTNHTFAWLVLGNTPARVNGALVCRNEDIIYGTPLIEFNYDCRLLGGGVEWLQDDLPRTLGPLRVVRWEVLDHDPNRYVPLQ